MVSRCVRYFFWIALFGTTISDVATISPIWTGNPDVQRTALSTMLGGLFHPRAMMNESAVDPKGSASLLHSLLLSLLLLAAETLAGCHSYFPRYDRHIFLDRMEKRHAGHDVQLTIATTLVEQQKVAPLLYVVAVLS
jgi:hypothetical protein